MPGQIDDFRRGVQENEHQQQTGGDEKLAVRVGAQTRVEQHGGNPQHKSHADDVPEIVPHALDRIADRNGPHTFHRLLDQAEDRTDQNRIDGTQQKAPGHAQGASQLKGKQHEQREYDDGEYHHPTSGQGTTGCVQGIPIEMQGRGKYGQHGVFARRQLRIKEKFLRPEKPVPSIEGGQ